MIDQFMVSGGDEKERVRDIKKATSVRVTVISKEGKVLFESDRDISGMENHKNRPEIIEASKNGTGYSIRYSSSVDRDMLYVAKVDGDRYVRMAYALKSIREKFFNFWLKAISLFGIALAVMFWVAYRINRDITSDLKRIDESLSALLDKKYKSFYKGVSCCAEFDKIYKRIERVSKKLKKREKQKQKYTKKLKDLTSKQSDIISAISHEFKNPIAAILGYTQTIREDRGLSDSMREKFLSKISKNAQKIDNMIDRLSMAIKLENDSSMPIKSEFDLKRVVTDVRENLLQKYRDREIVVEMDEVRVFADRMMFENLVINLVENALKYSEEEVLIRCDGRVFEVIDRGIGIDEKDMDKITKRFVRVDDLSWDNSIGVGLYLVKYILKLHGLSLEIDSRLGEGSKFWFDLSGVRVS
jgi:signal transduction histidine kinase